MSAAVDLGVASTLPPPPSLPLKQCRCGCVYTPSEWSGLEYVGLMDDGAGGTLELRNCLCGSTIAITLPGASS